MKPVGFFLLFILLQVNNFLLSLIIFRRVFQLLIFCLVDFIYFRLFPFLRSYCLVLLQLNFTLNKISGLLLLHIFKNIDLLNQLFESPVFNIGTICFLGHHELGKMNWVPFLIDDIFPQKVLLLLFLKLRIILIFLFHY